ncbi:Glyoxalase family protein [Acidisarcina polymorpha]|uniref:Glyoxalase family protein n=1 Tax=Acidisarcina polymorpha TaxID=2211140 RepID=A0A2Z5FUM7_9BACT|nr:VOC family protein [Acidisarcina polymorpha]AXC10450.1 Glyoxalase family protein [Acidisarcina polymorpha]
MTNKGSYIPSGYHNVTPYLYIDGAAEAIEFYKKALGATEVMRLPGTGGKIGHAEIQIGDSRIMLADQSEQMQAYGPKHYGGVSVSLMVYVEDVDSVFQRAVEAGATINRPLADQFYGDRTGGIIDPFGHHWYLGTHIKDVSPEEMSQGAEAMAGAGA